MTIATIKQLSVCPYNPQDVDFDNIEPYQSASNFYFALHDALDANYPFVFINCIDVGFIKRCIKGFAKYDAREFSFSNGYIENASWEIEDNCGITLSLPDSKQSIKKFHELLLNVEENYSVLLVHGFNSMVNKYPEVIEWLKMSVDFHANRANKSKWHSIIIVEPISNIPADLVPFSKMLELNPPDDEDIRRYYLKYLYDNKLEHIPSIPTNFNVFTLQKGLDLTHPQVAITPKEKELFDALRGFYPVEIDTLLNGVRTCGQIQVALNAKKELVKKTRGLRVVAVCDRDNEVGGLHNLKNFISETKKLLEHKGDLLRDGFALPKGILLVGMPGCGKSLSAKLVACQLGLPLYQLEMGSILGSKLGESETNFQMILRTVERVTPCVLWLDEMEKAFSGLDDSTGVMKHILGKFLTWLQDSDGSVFVFATANDISNIPPELKRKGRFDKVFGIQLPDTKERAEILMCHLKKISYIRQNYNDSSLYELCYKLSCNELKYKNEKDGRGVSGADIAAIVKTAYCKALLKGKRLTDNNDGGDSFLTEAIKYTMGENEMKKSFTQRDLMNVNRGYEKALNMLKESGFEPA